MTVKELIEELKKYEDNINDIEFYGNTSISHQDLIIKLDHSILTIEVPYTDDTE